MPNPLTIDEVMPDGIFFHHFYNPTGHYGRKWMNRLPKKLKTSIFDNANPLQTDEIPIGWGVHIEETPNRFIAWVVLLCILSASGIFSVTFAAITQDLQSAFTVGAYIVAVLTAVTGALFFHWNDK